MEKNLKKITDHYAAVCLKLKQWCMEIYLNKTGGNTVSSKFLLEARIPSYIWNYHNIVYQLYMKGRKKERKRKVRRRWVEGRKEGKRGGREEGRLEDTLQTHCRGNECRLQHARSPCSSAISRVYSNSCPFSRPQFSQHQGLFNWVRSLHQVDIALEFQLQHQSFQWIFRTDFL